MTTLTHPTIPPTDSDPSGFFSSLINSVFTPGLPSSLITATHTTFALLQLILFWLLYMTRSYHFVALIVIAGCLWGTVTWFVEELKRVDVEAERLRRVRREKGEGSEEEEEDALTLVGKEGEEEVTLVGKEGEKTEARERRKRET